MRRIQNAVLSVGTDDCNYKETRENTYCNLVRNIGRVIRKPGAAASHCAGRYDNNLFGRNPVRRFKISCSFRKVRAFVQAIATTYHIAETIVGLVYCRIP